MQIKQGALSAHHIEHLFARTQKGSPARLCQCSEVSSILACLQQVKPDFETKKR